MRCHNRTFPVRGSMVLQLPGVLHRWSMVLQYLVCYPCFPHSIHLLLL